jgi:monofunctional biosynthetic peptidoglycan transglycosylase
MIEIYLNIVEWAPGVYGPSRFPVPFQEACQSDQARGGPSRRRLPNPIKRKAGKPSKRVSSIANRIMSRMNGMGSYLACLGP